MGAPGRLGRHLRHLCTGTPDYEIMQTVPAAPRSHDDASLLTNPETQPLIAPISAQRSQRLLHGSELVAPPGGAFSAWLRAAAPPPPNCQFARKGTRGAGRRPFCSDGSLSVTAGSSKTGICWSKGRVSFVWRLFHAGMPRAGPLMLLHGPSAGHDDIISVASCCKLSHAMMCGI